MGHTFTKQNLRDAENQDPLADAELISGKSYKEDESVANLGLMLQIRKSAAVKQIAESMQDTYFSAPLSTYDKVFKELGIEQVFSISFYSESSKQLEFFNIHWGRGILFVYDTYWGGSKINGGNFYFNWKPKVEKKWPKVHFSGGFNEKLTLVGYHDIRCPLKLTIGDMEEEGYFLEKWEEKPFLWLLHHQDTKDKDYKYELINVERMKLLPQYVQKAIGV